jgi:hypothetical protein
MSASFGDGGIDLMHLGAILHELSFVLTKRSYILRGEIFKLTLHFLFVNSFHAYNVFFSVFCVLHVVVC